MRLRKLKTAFTSNGHDSWLADLLQPRAYSHPVTRVEHLQTHISHVFLAGDYAYKFKRPVDLGFLDFTTLDRRRSACEDEVRLNARLAPDIYLGVVTLCGSRGQHRIADAGCVAGETVVDYAVRMRRLPQEGMLDRLAATGRLKQAHIQDIARQMARFHGHADHRLDLDRYGDVGHIAAPIQQNFAQTERYIDSCLPRARFTALRSWSENFLHDNVARFHERVARGRIVDGHGDLHLGNMCLHHDRVVIFDCIEFNPALRCGDAINDIAFLVMDLTERGLPQLANAFLNEYLQETGDYHGLTLLDFYQVYRAYVRGKVNAFQIDGAGDAIARERARRSAQDYFQLAERLTAPRQGGVLITCGLSGSGKSTAARRAAPELDGIVVRSDRERKRLTGLAPNEHDIRDYGQGIYTAELTERTYAALLEHAREIVTAGRWVILDATYGSRALRAPAAALARELHVPFAILYCTAPYEELRRRLLRRAQLQRDVSDATVAILDEQLRRFEAPTLEEGRVFRTDQPLDTLLTGSAPA